MGLGLGEEISSLLWAVVTTGNHLCVLRRERISYNMAAERGSMKVFCSFSSSIYIFVGSVIGNIYFTTLRNVMVYRLLATLGFLFLSQQLPCIRNCSYGEHIWFQWQIILAWYLNYSTINRPNMLVYHDSGHGLLWIVQSLTSPYRPDRLWDTPSVYRRLLPRG
jgi:hypothetical protein